MCDDNAIEASDSLSWNQKALRFLRWEMSSTPREFEHLLDDEEHHPAFDPIKVRNLLREVHAQHHDPSVLLLGKIEMASFLHFITRGFGEECGVPSHELFFLGIRVIEDPALSRLEYIDHEDGFTLNDPHGHRAA